MSKSLKKFLTSDFRNYSVFDVLTLKNTYINGFWEIWMSIMIWVAISYIFAHIFAFLIAVVMLRHHKWMFFISCPFLGRKIKIRYLKFYLAMAFLGPTTLGALTSVSIALTFAMANKPITPIHCLLLGCGQTIIVVLTSFFRILATL